MIHQEIIDENKYGVSGGSRGGAQRARSSVILDEKRRNNRRNKSRESKQNKNSLPPLAQGLHPPLRVTKELFVHSYMYGTYW